MKKFPEYFIKKFPVYRRLSIDSTRLSRERNFIHGLVELDITAANYRLREYRKETGKKVSLTAWIIKAIAEIITDNPEVQAIRQRNKLIIYKDVDILFAVETMIDGNSFPVVHVIRKVQEKSAFTVSEEIRNLKSESLNENKLKQWKQVKYFLFLPWIIRKRIYKIFLASPAQRKKWMGTTAVTAVGMFGKGRGWGINLPNHTLAFTLGGIFEKSVPENNQYTEHRFIDISVHIDHDIVDGAPAARFISKLRKNLEHKSPEVI